MVLESDNFHLDQSKSQAHLYKIFDAFDTKFLTAYTFNICINIMNIATKVINVIIDKDYDCDSYGII